MKQKADKTTEDKLIQALIDFVNSDIINYCYSKDDLLTMIKGLLFRLKSYRDEKEMFIKDGMENQFIFDANTKEIIGIKEWFAEEL